MPAELQGRKALVVGADSGIGLATARAFAAAGADVMMGGLDAEAGQRNAAEIGADSGRTVHFQRADVLAEDDMAALASAAAERLGGFDMAFNNAGIEGPAAPLHEIRIEDFDRLVAVNLRGIWLGMKYQIPHLIARGGGSIVNTSSTAGVKAIPNVGIYTATKHAIIGLTKAGALELGGHGIRINAIAPGPVATGLLKRMAESRGNTAETMKARLPLGRISEPEEIAEAVVWLSSDAASYITGSVLFADGGLTAT